MADRGHGTLYRALSPKGNAESEGLGASGRWACSSRSVRGANADLNHGSKGFL